MNMPRVFWKYQLILGSQHKDGHKSLVNVAFIKTAKSSVHVTPDTTSGNFTAVTAIQLSPM